MSRIITRDPIPARFLGDVNPYTVLLKVTVRAGMGKDLPTRRELENKIADDLLSMKRLDEGAAWDVASVIIPDPSNVQQIVSMLNKLRQLTYATKDVEVLFQLSILEGTIKELLGLEDK